MSRRFTHILAGLAAVAVVGTAVAAGSGLPPPYSDLVRVKAKRVGDGYLLPGADFRSYTKVIIDPAEVAFQKDWMRNVNQSPGVRRVDEEDAKKIAEAARSGFAEVWADAFRKGGYEVVTEPGPGVLRLSPGIVNLYINAPDTMQAGRSRTYTVEAGEATLILQVRDAATGATLGLALDRRYTRSTGNSLNWTTSVSNKSDFMALFRKWADICVQGLDDLKEKSPLPAELPEAKKK